MKNLLKDKENDGNLKYRISEKTKAQSDLNINALMANVETLYENCIKNMNSESNNDSDNNDSNDNDSNDNDSNDNESNDNESNDNESNDNHSDIELHLRSEILATSLHYESNINRDKLEQICNYYKIQHRKKKKPDLAKDLAIFEHDACNYSIVEKRKRLWQNIAELKQDDYFKQYITFNV